MSNQNCTENISPCERRRKSSDNVCAHYPVPQTDWPTPKPELNIAASQAKTVGQYFLALLGGRGVDDPLTAECPLDSTVGDDCRDAINAAALLMTHSEAAYGGVLGGVDHKSYLRMIAKAICQVYYRG